MQVTNLKVTDNSELFKKAKNEAVARALEAMGLLAENYAKENIIAASRVDTGRMLGSVAHTVKDDTAYVGSNVEYAA